MTEMARDVSCCASRQLETALPHYFEGEDYYSVTTLAGAAEEVFGKLLTLTWGDIRDAEDSDGILIDVRFSKSNQEGDTDVRYVKGPFARAIRRLRTERNGSDALGQRVLGLSPQQIGRRFSACAKAAGLDGRYTAHSGRVGLASELTRRGAPTAAVQLAGGWRSARMVTHYSSGATAERGSGREVPMNHRALRESMLDFTARGWENRVLHAKGIGLVECCWPPVSPNRKVASWDQGRGFQLINEVRFF